MNNNFIKKYCQLYLKSKTPLDELLKNENIQNNNSVTIAESSSNNKNKWWLLATKNGQNTIKLSLETESDILDTKLCSSNKTLSDNIAQIIKNVCNDYIA